MPWLLLIIVGAVLILSSEEKDLPNKRRKKKGEKDEHQLETHTGVGTDSGGGSLGGEQRAASAIGSGNQTGVIAGVAPEDQIKPT